MSSSRMSFLLLTTSIFAMSGAAVAMAQDDVVEEVVVTGTRLPAGLTAPTPVSTVSTANIQQKAPSQILEAL